MCEESVTIEAVLSRKTLNNVRLVTLESIICRATLLKDIFSYLFPDHRNIQQSNDIESVKLSIDDDDLPSYTLVSGLPSYDAALEQLQRSSASNSCLLMYPSVFKIFTTNEKQDVFPGSVVSSSNEANSTTSSPHQYHTVVAVVPSYQEATSKSSEAKCDEAAAPSYQEALLPSNLRSTSWDYRKVVMDVLLMALFSLSSVSIPRCKFSVFSQKEKKL